ncbi:hypothetical protein LXL04_034277 [Taraxacum kok-saghyz]
MYTRDLRLTLNVRVDQVSRFHNQITQKLHTVSILQKKTCCKTMKHPEVELNNNENPDLGIEDASEMIERLQSELLSWILVDLTCR